MCNILLKVMSVLAVGLVLLAALADATGLRCQGFWPQEGTGPIRKNCLGPRVRATTCRSMIVALV